METWGRKHWTVANYKGRKNNLRPKLHPNLKNMT